MSTKKNLKGILKFILEEIPERMPENILGQIVKEPGKSLFIYIVEKPERIPQGNPRRKLRKNSGENP